VYEKLAGVTPQMARLTCPESSRTALGWIIALETRPAVAKP